MIFCSGRTGKSAGLVAPSIRDRRRLARNVAQLAGHKPPLRSILTSEENDRNRARHECGQGKQQDDGLCLSRLFRPQVSCSLHRLDREGCEAKAVAGETERDGGVGERLTSGTLLLGPPRRYLAPLIMATIVRNVMCSSRVIVPYFM